MAITLTETFPEEKMDHVFIRRGKFAADSSYPTGGYDVTVIDPHIKDFFVLGGGTYIWHYDRSTKKVKAMKVSGANLVEETNGTNLAGQTDIYYLAVVDALN